MAMYQEVISNLRDIARRIGVARNPLEVRAEIEALANKLELWDARPIACNLPGEDGSDRWKPGITDNPVYTTGYGYTDEGKGGID